MSEDVWNRDVDIVLENVAVFATILEMVNDPAGFVMVAEPSVNVCACVALIALWTVRLLVVMEFDAVRLSVLIPGRVIASEKRRSAPRYVMYFSLKERELMSDMELVVKNTLLVVFCTTRFELMTTELEKVADPPMLVVPRTSRLFAITEPFGARKFPSVIMSPRAPKAPSEDIVPRTNRLLPVLSEPVKRAVPSTSTFP